MDKNKEAIKSFIAEWSETSQHCRKAFIELKEFLERQKGTSLEFIARPGVTYSLRAVHSKQSKQPLFVMVDVIDSEPRWLSVCFYGQMVTDPEERGDYVPGGLLGEDGICFDVEVYSEDFLTYLTERIAEAHAAAE